MAWQEQFGRAEWRIGSSVVGIGAALAYLAQIVVGLTLPSWLKIALGGIGTLLIFFSIALPNWQVRQEIGTRKAALRTANEAISKYDVKLHQTLVPLSKLLAGVITARADEDRRVLQERMKQAVIDCAVDNIQGSHPRSCFYAYREFNDDPKRRLVLDGPSRGRNTQPREQFVCGDDAGNEALRILDAREVAFVRNADEELPPGWHRDCDYKTYIQATVASGDTVFGLLGVDAVHPGDLTDIDRRMILLLAQLLGCALGIGGDTHSLAPGP